MTLPCQEGHPKTPIRVLIVEDSPEVAVMLVETLRHGGYDPDFQRVDTAEDYETALSVHPWDIVFSDHSIGHFNSITALHMVRDRGLQMPFIVISGVVDETVHQSVLRAGASDFISKAETWRLVPVVARELGAVKEREHNRWKQEVFSQSEARFRLLYDQSPVAYQTLDSEGRLVDVNPAWASLLGFHREEVLGRGFGSFMTREGADLFRQDLRDLMNSGTSKKEYVLVSKDARHINVVACGQVGYCSPGRGDKEPLIWYEYMLLHGAEAPNLHESGQPSTALSGMLPICMYCKKIRDQQGDWHRLEEYIEEHTQAHFTHGICPDCVPKHFPDIRNQ